MPPENLISYQHIKFVRMNLIHILEYVLNCVKYLYKININTNQSHFCV